VHVLATPQLLHWIEATIAQLWKGHRDVAEEVLLGTEFHLKHLAAAGVGQTVTVRAVVAQVERRRVGYRFEASTPERLICEGTSENVLMPLARFQQRLTGPTPPQ